MDRTPEHRNGDGTLLRKFCAVCGGDNRQGAQFCRHCGVALASPVGPALPPDAASPVAAADGQEEEEVTHLPPEPGEAQSLHTPLGQAPESDEPQVPSVEPALVGPIERSSDGEAQLAVELDDVRNAQLVPEEGWGTPSAVEAIHDAAGVVEEEVEATRDPNMETGVATPGVEAVPPEDAAPAHEVERPGEVAPVVIMLEPGTVVADRYLVLEALEADGDRALFRVRDLLGCWQCGYAGTPPMRREGDSSGEAYCPQCGAALDRTAEARLLELRDPEDEPAAGPRGETVVERLDYEGRSYLLLAATGPGEEGDADIGREGQAPRLSVGQRSDTGQVRELNEDSVLILIATPTYESTVSPLLGLLAVADGMGGHKGGERASKLALQVVAGEVLRSVFQAELTGTTLAEQAVVAHLQAAVVAANDAVYLERHRRENDMGTTLTVALLRDSQAFLAHVGDCRAYRWGVDGLVQLTTDHSMVASLIASGRAEPDEVYTHPQRSIIYRCIGDRPRVEVDTAVLPIAPDDRLILCSDGLWEMIRDEGIADVMMLEADPQAACDRLVQRANVAGGEDNISAVVAQMGGVGTWANGQMS